MAGLGEQKNEALSIDKLIFKKELKHLMNCHKEMDAFIFFKLVHTAHDKVTKNHSSKNLIFYHIHNPA